MKYKDSTELFRNTPVPQAVMKNALPAMAAMLMVLIYNLNFLDFYYKTVHPKTKLH